MLEIISALDLSQEVQDLYARGLPPGASTGFPSLDRHYTVAKGQWTAVTGVPGHGKSEFLDAILVNLAWQGWRFCMFSPENQPHQLHIAKLVEKFARKPFGEGPQERLSPAELKAGMFHVESAFSFLRVSKEFAAVPSLDSVLDGCQRVLQRWMDDFSMTPESPNWKCGVVIDPWNEMDHGRPNNMSETEYISSCLSVIRQFARDWNIHIWLVAHPAKLQKDKDNTYPVARLWDISGSAHWANKCDAGITVWRNVTDPHSLVQIHVQKVRFRNVGKPGLVELGYDRASGCYWDQWPNWKPHAVRVQREESECPV